MPLFPLLYTKESDSKIEMTKQMFLETRKIIDIHTVMFDSWYADNSLIKLIKTKETRVICQVKTNRSIKEDKTYVSLKKYSDQIKLSNEFWIGGTLYRAEKQIVKLKKVPKGTLVFSEQYFVEPNTWSRHIHIFSTQKNDTLIDILRTYKIRWAIEVMHRDLKQNLGFNKAMIRSERGIVRHEFLESIVRIA